jgi:hypothetical protein
MLDYDNRVQMGWQGSKNLFKGNGPAGRSTYGNDFFGGPNLG